MIFDNNKIACLVAAWQIDQDCTTMEEILRGSMSLIEAIVSSYNSVDRDDLIQEACARIQNACKYYNPKVATLHNYFTTVIHNICRTYSDKQDKLILYGDFAKESDIDDGEDYIEETLLQMPVLPPKSDLLDELIIHNRKRFPSLPAVVLDDISEYIYFALQYTPDTSRAMSTQIETKYSVSRAIAIIICQSSFVFLRNMNLTCAEFNPGSLSEFSLIVDLMDVLDSQTFKQVMIVFSGMSLRIT